MSKMMKILGISGSIRKNSYNTLILKHIQSTMAKKYDHVEFEIADISNLPLYNQDIEDYGTAPESVAQFRDQVRSSHALLFSTPEHNYSIPAAMKNALDWGSRPYGQNSFENKPGAIISSSIGMMGGVKAQIHLRHILSTGLNVHLLNRPETIVPFAQQRVSEEDGSITDPTQEKLINAFVDEMVAWAERMKNPQ